MAIARQCLMIAGSWCLGLKKKIPFFLFGNSICVCLSEKDKEISEADGKGKEERAIVVQFLYKKQEIELLFCTPQTCPFSK